MKLEKNKIIKIAIIISSILVVAVLGSIFVNLGMDWYATLNKPSEWVPNVLIPIMWTIIYITFAIILSIWEIKGEIPNKIIALLIVNGILNILWCLFFFTLNLTLIGNISIILLLISSIILFNEMLKLKPLYAYICAIYPIWVCIATTLNTAIWILN